MQHLQAGYVMAARRPRNQHEAYQRIIEACKRQGLAEESSYLFARGGTQITGASIRLLEAIFTCWGNVQSGVIELEQANGESQMMAFAIDLETNCYDSKIFTVKHERYSRTDGITKLADPTDIYLHVANFAARRKRTCMEAIIPRDIVDAALEQCDKTLKTGHSEPLADRVRKMVAAFADQGVTVEMLERRLQHKLSAVIEQEMVLLRKIFTAIKDGIGKREDYFEVGAAPKPAKFDKKDMGGTTGTKEPVEDEAALAKAGLAPQTSTVPAQEPAKESKATPQPEPPKSGLPQTQAPAAAQEPLEKSQAPAPVQTDVPKKSISDLFGAQAQAQAVNPLAKEALDLLVPNKVTEEEIINVLKVRGICEPATTKLSELSEVILKDLVANMEIIAAQVRIDKKSRKK